MDRPHIRGWRLYRGISQQALGEALGGDKYLIHKMEKGGRRLRADEQVRLEKALKLEPGQLWEKPPETSAGKRASRKPASKDDADRRDFAEGLEAIAADRLSRDQTRALEMIARLQPSDRAFWLRAGEAIAEKAERERQSPLNNERRAI